MIRYDEVPLLESGSLESGPWQWWDWVHVRGLAVGHGGEGGGWRYFHPYWSRRSLAVVGHEGPFPHSYDGRPTWVHSLAYYPREDRWHLGAGGVESYPHGFRRLSIPEADAVFLMDWYGVDPASRKPRPGLAVTFWTLNSAMQY